MRARRGWPRGFVAPTVVFLVGAALAYAAAGHFLTIGGVSVWYPPAAVSLAYIAVVGARRGGAFVLGARLVAGTLIGRPFHLHNLFVTSLIVCAAYVAAGEWLHRRLGNQRSDFRTVALFIGSAAVGTAVAAIGAVGYLVASGPLAIGRYPSTVVSFWLGDASATFTLAPLAVLILWSAPAVKPPRRSEGLFRLELAGSSLLLLAACWLTVVPDSAHPHFYPTFVPMAWLAMRGGFRRALGGIAATGVLVPTFAIVADATIEDMTEVQLYLVVFAVSGLLLAAAESDRQASRARLAAAEVEQRAQVDALEEADARFRSAFENAPFGVELASTHAVIAVNRQMLEITGRSAEVLQGQGVAPFLHPEDAMRVAREVAASEQRGDQVLETEARLWRPDGEERWIRGVVVAVNDSGPVTRIVHVYDITEQKRARQAAADADAELRANQARFAALVERSADVLCLLDADGQVTYASPAVTSVLGASPASLLGSSLLELVHPDDRSRLEHHVHALAQVPGDARTIEVRAGRGDAPRSIEIVATNRLADEAVSGIVANIRDVTDRAEAAARIQWQAFHDPLTGLPNRTLLLDRLGESLRRSRRTHDVVALLFLDLDRFKLVNDTMGHEAGDQLLREVGDRLSALARPGDTVARFGGDEFVILAEGLRSPSDAEGLAHRIAGALAAPFTLGAGVVVTTSASIGIAIDAGHTPATLLRDADTALYRAKERGRARHEFFDESLRSEAIRRVAAENLLRRVLDEGQLVVHYQPIVDLATGAVLGAEALLRVPGPGGELQSPAEFIAVAEESGLINAVGAGVLDAACGALHSWRMVDPERALRVSVNVSPRELASPGLAAMVERALARWRLPASALVVELTESTLIHADRTTEANINGLHDLGIGLAIDDFGTGYSSLAYLKRFPIDIVKIDRSFVAGLGSDPNDTEIVRAVLSLGRSLGLLVVAEGIETEAQLDELRALGCDAGQGHLLAVPAPSDRIPVFEPAALLS